MKKLIAIDGNSLMHRAYYALPSMTNKAGTPTGAVYGFMSMLMKLIADAPDYLLVAFDMHGPTFRHAVYEEYKAGRKATPEDLRPQFPILQDLLRDMHITVCECESYEADDILGTFSRIANREGIDALLVTGDRDALQLITPQTHVLLTKKGITETVEYDEAQLLADYGLTPARMPDLKGLMGDNSDHIPGIPGVGEKTALTLLKKYETLENVLAHAEDEKGALREKLLKNGDLARMSYTLGVIDTAAPVTTRLADCAFDPARMADGIPMMQTLELRSLISRMPQVDAAQTVQPLELPDIE
ncbi:MAG: 5'-3' exonuclease H3TH domain-containing protein, partial [Clostridia bacterium]|nr:5'-3' exonuclease H3TH domain-containing protein [Clostridia bacterium]